MISPVVHEPAAQKGARRRSGGSSGASQTIDDLAELFLDRYVTKECQPSTAKAYERYLRKNVLPRWQGRDAASIHARDVRLLLEGIARTAPVLANRLRATLSKMFVWAIGQELLEANPVTGVARPAREVSRERVLSDAELKLLMDAADALRNPVEKQFVHMLILTMQRRSEVSGMVWAEIDLTGRPWNIPAERCKNKRAHRLPLSSAAVAILEARPRDTDFVFPNARGEPFATFAPLKRELDRLITEANGGVPIAPWTLHDLRRSAASAMPRLGVDLATTERLLNHVSGSFAGIVRVYQRHSYEAEMREAAEAWATHLAKICANNAIPLRCT